MLQTILVPLDGSALAERALPCAISLARRADARILLVRATLARTLPGLDPTRAQIEARQEAEGEIETAAARVRAFEVEVETSVYYDQAALAVSDAARYRRADLIVMSTHGRSGVGRWVYGSVADAVLRRAEVPVLLISAACAHPWAGDEASRLLVPLDGSALAEEALPAAMEFADTLGVGVLLLRVVEPPNYALYTYAGAYDGYFPLDVPFDEKKKLQAARRYLESIASEWQATGRRVDLLAVAGQPATMIPAVAQEEQVGAIAMATHGRGGVARLVMDSVAAGVLQRASVPVCIRSDRSVTVWDGCM